MSRVRSAVLTTGAVVGALCLLLAVAGLAFGVKPLIFRSGSMGPEIPAGALALARPVAAADLAVGDVVSVVSSERQRVTHRVVAIEGAGPSRALTLQGDANPAPDAETYQVARADRVFWSVPWVGYGVAFLGTPLGMFLLGGFAVGVLALGFWPTRERSGRRAAMVAVPAAVALTAYGATGTAAAFTDSAAVTGGALTAHTMVAQAQPTCTNDGGLLGIAEHVDIRFSKTNAGYEYTWQLRNAGTTTVVASGTIGGSAAPGAVVLLEVMPGLIGANGNFDVVIRARLANATSWVAAASTTTPIRRVGIGLAPSIRCGYL